MGKFDPKKFQREADAAADAAMRHGEEWAAKAQHFVEEGADWIAPRAQKLWDETVKTAGPVIEDATEKVRPYLDEAEERVRPYLKDAQSVAEDYAKRGRVCRQGRSEGRFQEGHPCRARTACRRSHPQGANQAEEVEDTLLGKFLGWTLLAPPQLVLATCLWRRSQPIEDPGLKSTGPTSTPT